MPARARLALFFLLCNSQAPAPNEFDARQICSCLSCSAMIRSSCRPDALGARNAAPVCVKNAKREKSQISRRTPFMNTCSTLSLFHAFFLLRLFIVTCRPNIGSLKLQKGSSLRRHALCARAVPQLRTVPLRSEVRQCLRLRQLGDHPLPTYTPAQHLRLSMSPRILG